MLGTEDDGRNDSEMAGTEASDECELLYALDICEIDVASRVGGETFEEVSVGFNKSSASFTDVGPTVGMLRASTLEPWESKTLLEVSEAATFDEDTNLTTVLVTSACPSKET